MALEVNPEEYTASRFKRMEEKKRIFAQAYVRLGGNVQAAAKEAGYKTKERDGSGYKLLNDPVVRADIANLQKEARARNNIDIDKVVNNLLEVYECALRDAEYGHANRSMELIGKYLGMFTDRISKTLSIVSSSQEEKDVDADIERLARAAGITNLKALTSPSASGKPDRKPDTPKAKKAKEG